MQQRVRFQGDANFNELIVRGLRRRHPMIDIQTGAEANLRGMLDPEVLARAAQSGRILLTHNFHTMPTHFGGFLANGQHTPGVILLHQLLPLAEAIDTLELVWEASTPAEWYDTFRTSRKQQLL